MDTKILFYVTMMQLIIVILFALAIRWIYRIELLYSQFKNLQANKISITKYNAAHDKFDNWLISKKRHFSCLGILFVVMISGFVYVDNIFIQDSVISQWTRIIKCLEIPLVLTIYLWVTFRIIWLQSKL